MSVGIVMLVHNALDRAEQAARHWAMGGCPVVIHVDAAVPRKTFSAFSKALSRRARNQVLQAVQL